MTITLAIYLICAIVGISVGHDLYGYSDRQTKWEREHPGQTYTRGYKKLQKAMDKAATQGGQP